MSLKLILIEIDKLITSAGVTLIVMLWYRNVPSITQSNLSQVGALVANAASSHGTSSVKLLSMSLGQSHGQQISYDGGDNGATTTTGQPPSFTFEQKKKSSWQQRCPGCGGSMIGHGYFVSRLMLKFACCHPNAAAGVKSSHLN
jgi:hypothetical protein